jgi:hypothetical protein
LRLFSLTKEADFDVDFYNEKTRLTVAKQSIAVKGFNKNSIVQAAKIRKIIDYQ